MTAIRCPYGERRGAAVYCKAAGRMVNPLVMPCRSPNYVRCRFYREARRKGREERAGYREEAAAAPGGRGDVGEPPRPVASQGALDVPLDWSEKESEELADPLTLAKILLEATPLTAGRIKAASLSEFMRAIAGRTGVGSEGCYVAVITPLGGGGGELYLKICDGRLRASAARGGPVKPEVVNASLRSMGEASVLVYRLPG